jgi:hypothetical protein
MSELRGRPLYYVALTLVAWVGGRLAWESDWQSDLPPAEKIADRAVTLPAPSLQKESVYTRLRCRVCQPYKQPVSDLPLPWTLGRTVAGLPVYLHPPWSRAAVNP